MPAIPEYNSPSAPVSEVRPSETGIQASTQAGYRVGRFYNQIGEDVGRGITEAGRTSGEIMQQVQQHQTTQQFVEGMRASTATQLQFEQQKQDVLAHSNDPVADIQKLGTAYGEALDKIGGTFTTDQGQRMWAEHSASANQQFQVHGMADALTAVGDKTLTTVENAQNNFVGLVNTNPHNLTGYLDQVDQLYDGAKANLTPQQQDVLEKERVKTHEQLALVQVSALAKQNPKQTLADLASGALGKDSAGNSLFTGEGMRAAQAIVQHEITEQDVQMHKAALDSVDNFLAGHIDTKTGRFTISPSELATIQSDPTIPGELKLHALTTAQNIYREQRNQEYADIEHQRAGVRFNEGQTEFAQQQARRAAETPIQESDPSTVGLVRQRLGSANPPTPNEIDDLFNAKKISLNDRYQLRYDASVAQQAMKDGKPSPMQNQIVRSEMTRGAIVVQGTQAPTDPVVIARVNQWKADTARTINQWVASGKPLDALLDPKNPNNPFADDKIKPYTVSAEDSANGVVTRFTPPTGAPPAHKLSLFEHFKNASPAMQQEQTERDKALISRGGT